MSQKYKCNNFLMQKQHILFLTFNVNLSRSIVCSKTVGCYAGVTSRIVLEGFSDHQGVPVTVPPDLYVGGVV